MVSLLLGMALGRLVLNHHKTWGGGITLRNCTDVGLFPRSRDWFTRAESDRARNKANSRMSFAGISPGKGETFVFTFLMSL